MKDIVKNNKYFLIGLVSLLALLIIWEISARITNLSIAFPTFSSVVIALAELFVNPSFYSALLFTTMRCLIGYLVAFILAVILGIFAGRIKAVESIMAPFVSVMKAMPVVAITLILAVWVDSTILPSIIGVLLVFPVLYTQIKTATQNIDPVLLDVMKEMGGGFVKDTFNIYLPMVLPFSLAGISATFGMNVKAVVSAELLAYAKNSIGYAIYFAKANFLEEIPTLFAYTIIAVVMSVVFEIIIKKAFSLLTKRFSYI